MTSYFTKWSLPPCRKSRVLANGPSLPFGDVVYGCPLSYYERTLVVIIYSNVSLQVKQGKRNIFRLASSTIYVTFEGLSILCHVFFVFIAVRRQQK